MKTKKALAVVLAVVMLVIPLAVSSFAAGTILTNPIKTAYNDSEHFNPQGLVILVDGNVLAYSPVDTNFRFDPALDELLSVEITKVDVYYDNAFVGSVTVTVEHILDEKLTAIDKSHGNYCLGCGEIHNLAPHVVENWIPNDDGGIFTMQTQTGFCVDCGAEITEPIPGTAQFLQLFDLPGLTEIEAKAVVIFDVLIRSLVQMLVGIY